MDIIVPIDLTEEEKEVLAVFSKRQFLIVFPTLGASLFFLVFGNLLFVDGLIDFGLRFLISFISIGTAVALAFVRLDKYEQYLSEFIVTKIKYRVSQKIYHP